MSTIRKVATIILSLASIVTNGQGFSTSATNWSCPGGGDITSGITNGYNAVGGTAVNNDNAGSQSWSVVDMNGDGYLDLIVTAQLQGGNVTSFSPSSNQYWKVYEGNGNGFSTSAINWNCPNGGMIDGGITYGYNALGGFAQTSHNTGSQTWSVIDMNNDAKPDLVVTAQLQGGNVTSFSPTSNQYWKVYFNTGSGFSTSATNWNCPGGGDITSGITNGYNAVGGSAVTNDNAGSQSWSVVDMNGDGYLDLIVTAQLQGGNVTSFSPSSNQYWKVYEGNGNGFSTSATNWNCPNGGMIDGGITYGYNALGGFAQTSHNTGSQTWSVIDMNNDAKPDLIVTAQLQGGNVTSFSPTSNQYWKVYFNTGSGFSTSATNWNCPGGGDITSGITNGYNAVGGTAVTNDNAGSQSWSMVDINGDGYLDMVVTAQLQGGNVTSFSPSSNQYWKIYEGNGNGFSTAATNWNCPNGGMIDGGITYGYNALGGFAQTSHNTGSQTWSVIDMNNDAKPDLIVTAQLQGGNVTSFSPTNNQYWKVYLNTSTIGVNQINDLDIGYKLFPNPACDFIQIELASSSIAITEVVIQNLQGQLIEQRKLNSTNNFILDLKNYIEGFYFITIKDTHQNLSSQKFEKR